jgi:hypothetical protein
MGVTNTIHPPAGATALLCSTDQQIEELGWFLVPLVGLGSCLMVGVACVVNNVQRTFPVYWWTGEDLRGGEGGDRELAGEEEEVVRGEEDRVVVDGERIVIPQWLTLDDRGKASLEVLRGKLSERLGREGSRDSEMTEVLGVGDGGISC